MTDQLTALQSIFSEFYYWVTVVMMFLIHVGFCMYEVGVSRNKHHQATLMKNTMVIPLVTITWFFFGWWIYWAFPTGPGIAASIIPLADGSLNYGLRTDDGLFNANSYLANSPLMGVNLTDHLGGVFWAAFLLFSWTAASIVSGALIERITTFAFLILAVAIGSVFWTIDAAWGWHFDGWMLKVLGYHDAYASGVIHAIAGGFALGVLIVLGPRIGKFSSSGEPRNIGPRNPWLVTVGLFLIYTGFWGFYAACNVPIYNLGPEYGVEGVTFWTATNIYLTPTTLSGITFNFLMSLSGGLLAGYVISKGDPFWTYSLGLAGVICASAGNDLYHPIQAMIVGMIGGVIPYKLHYWVENTFKIDDAVGAVAVHGYGGFIGVVIAGFILNGYPSSGYSVGAMWDTSGTFALINPLGNFLGAIIMFLVLGLIPGYVLAKILNAFGKLRIPREVEIAGLDYQIMEDDKEAEKAFTSTATR
ncbi:MAG: ammonium transporter [Pelagibacteraceae bacterium]|nr:ammonium transporter [Pelagibacteraceae bacterium]PHX89452.1 MAG: ammonium transporter [Pelagibacteraceae bacterium]